MRIEQTQSPAFPSALVGHVPCKINLFLEVVGKRPDGYHDLDTVMLAVDLCDTLTIRSRSDTEILLRGTASEERFADDDPAWDIPWDPRNLVVRALRRLQSALGVNQGAEVAVQKRIPAQAGLGGGSADAAAALVLASLAWSGRLHWPLLCELARDLGSDLNFFLEGWKVGRWTARCAGRGERVYPVVNLAEQHVVIVHPPQGCDTAAIFRSLTDQNPQSIQSSKSPRRNSSEMLEALAGGDNERLGALLYNRLEGVASQGNPWIDRAARWFDRYKPLGHCLSGSGSARFCLCSGRQEAEKIGSELESLNQFRVFVASTWQSPSIQEQVKHLGFVE